jgi:hypothetical protein
MLENLTPFWSKLRGILMYRNLKKMWPAAAASLVAFTSLLSAADDAQVRNLENRVSALEQKRSARGMINPNAGPCVNGSDFFITADLLYMQAHQDGLTYGIENKDGNTFVNDGDMKDPHFKWNVGFRVGLGYKLPCDGWDLTLDWTRIHNHASNKDDQPLPGTIYASWGNPQAANVANTGTFNDIEAEEAKVHWRLRLNVLDLELGRAFYTSKWLTLRPFIGLRAAWVHQKYRVKYEDGPFTIAQGSGGRFGDLRAHMKNNYYGVGPRAGFDTEWGLSCGWSIYGDVAVSLLLGRFHVDQDVDFEPSSSSTELRQLGVDHHFTSGKAVTDLAIGLRWERSFCDCCYYLRLQAGYEHHLFFSQNQMNRFVDSAVSGAYVSNLGDLSLHGWSLSARFDF